MSAVIIQADSTEGVTLLTDGADFDPTNGYRLKGFVSKVAMLPQVPCLLTSLGNSSIVDFLVYSHSGRWASFDLMKTRIAADVADTQRRISLSLDTPVSGEVFFGGWSEASREFEAWRLAFFDDRQNDAEPKQIRGLLYQPAPLVEPELTSLDDLVALMEAMRAEKHSPFGREDVESFHVVGGFVQLTTLTRGGVRSRIVHRWPDRIGEKIDPQQPR